MRHGHLMGYSVVLYCTDKPKQVLQRHRINTTSITLRDLIPYESYQLEVRFVNQVGDGPEYIYGFRTLEDSKYFFYYTEFV